VTERARSSPHARLVRATAVAAVLALAAAWPAAAGQGERIEISSRQLSQFRIGGEGMRFGPLEFVGGLEMRSPSRLFGSLSAFRFLVPGGDFVGVTDTGFWFFGAVQRDAGHRPTGFGGLRMEPIADLAGRLGSGKTETDAEGLAVGGGVAIVAFEHRHRIAEYRLGGEAMGAPIRDIDFLVPARELRRNRGFETVARAPADGPLAGGLVVVSERSLDESGNVFAAILDGPGKGIFTVRRTGAFDITDGAFLPGGDLLVLERSFGLAAGVAMRLRRLEAASIGRGKVADGPVLMEADMGYQIDNMEGMDVWRRADGALIVSLVSDDNHSLLQRNLYLEFILHQD